MRQLPQTNFDETLSLIYENIIYPRSRRIKAGNILNEMALEKESDVIYLSQLLNKQRLDWKSDAAIPTDEDGMPGEVNDSEIKSANIMVSRGFNKAIRNHFGAKIKYPMRLVVDDVNNRTNMLGRREIIKSDMLRPEPGIITFYLHPSIAAAAHHTTPFIIGHNVGHTMQETHSETNLEDEILDILQIIIDEEPKLQRYAEQHKDYMPGSGYDDDMYYDIYGYKKDQSRKGAALYAYDTGDIYTLFTPSLEEITDENTEWVPNLVGLYMKYGRIKFKLGDASKIEKFFDSILRSYIGKVVAIG